MASVDSDLPRWDFDIRFADQERTHLCGLPGVDPMDAMRRVRDDLGGISWDITMGAAVATLFLERSEVWITRG